MILARHGETQWNTERRLQGSLDSPLTARGKIQAEMLGYTIKEELPIEADIVSSNKGRAIATRDIVAQILSSGRVSCDPRLNEMNFGTHEGMSLEQRQTDPLMKAQLKQREQNKFHGRLPEGENYADVETRVREYFRENDQDFRVVIAHEAVNRMILKVLGNLSEDDSMSIVQPNDVIYMIMDGEITHKRIGQNTPWIDGIMTR